MMMAADGTMFTWNDSAGPYKGNTASIPGTNAAPFTPWSAVINGNNFPSSWLQAPTPYLGQGVWEIASAPNNSSFIYTMIVGIAGDAATNLFKSIDGGVTWTLTTFPTNSLDSNATQSGTYSQAICIDPNSNNNAWVSSDINTYVTTDGGSTWNTCASLPANTQCFAMCFDPTTANRLIVGSLGNGLYVSTNANLGASATFTHIVGSITNPAEGRIGSDGTYYCTNGVTGGGIYRLTTGNTFSQILTVAGAGTVTLAVDPNNPGRVFTWEGQRTSFGNGPLVMNSTAANTGSPSWVGQTDKSMSSTPDAPHVANSFNNVGGTGAFGNTFLTTTNGMWFDPWTTTSASTVGIVGSGNVTLNVPDSIPNITIGRQLRATNTGTPTNYMIGNVASYTSLGGGRANLTLTLIGSAQGGFLGGPSGGSGSFSAWTISAERVYMSSGPGGGPSYVDGFVSGVQNVGSCTYGLEGSSIYDAVWPVGGNPILCTQDRGIFPIPTNPWNAGAGVVTEWGFGPYNGLFQSTTIAVSPSNPLFWVTAGFSGVLTSSNPFTTHAWTALTQPTAGTGSIACGNPNTLITTGGPGSPSQGMQYTKNGGAPWTVPSINITTGSYNSTTGLVTLNLGSTPAFPLVDSPGAGNVADVSGLVDTPYTVSAGTYNNSTGLATLTLSPAPSMSSGTNTTINLTGTGTNIGQLDGSFAVTVSGSTISYSVAAGLNTGSGVIAIGITGGSADVISNLDGAFVLASVVGSTITYTGPTGLGTVSIAASNGAVAGTTWVVMPSPAPTSGWSFASPFINSHTLDFDATTSGPFIFYAFNVVSNNGFVYQISVPSSSGAPTVTQKAQITSGITQAVGPGLALKCVPGHAGHLFWSAGANSSANTVSGVFSSHPNGGLVTGGFTKLQFSSNSGGTFTTLSTTQEVITSGLGAPSTDAGTSGYPTIFAVGWCGGGQYGLYKCINFNPASLGSETWTLMSNYLGTYGIGPPVCVAGDPNQEGRCIVGINGNGAAIFQQAGKANSWFP